MSALYGRKHLAWGEDAVADDRDAVGRGHTGSGVSTATYVETARQLMGKAGSRQVQGARFAFQITSGGSGMNNIATVWGGGVDMKEQYVKPISAIQPTLAGYAVS